MKATLSLWPKQVISPGNLLTVTVSWSPAPAVKKYRVTVTYAPDLAPGPYVKVVDAVATNRMEERTAILIPAMKDGFQDVSARVEAMDDWGQAPHDCGAAGEDKTEILVRGEWMSADVVYDLKKNFDEVLGATNAAVSAVASQMKNANENGVRLRSAAATDPAARKLWEDIRQSSDNVGWDKYAAFMDANFSRSVGPAGTMAMPFSQVDAYLRLKGYTELFLLENVGVIAGAPLPQASQLNGPSPHVGPVASLPGVPPGPPGPGGAPAANPTEAVLNQVIGARPYLRTVIQGSGVDASGRIDDIAHRLRYPVFIELIWSYWMEESMMVQSLNAIKRRFENRLDGDRRDPLAQFEMDPLRPLNNILWGFIQDEQHRLSVKQRAYEYLHHYGMGLEGRGLGRLRPADTRSRFLQTFHNLLYQCVQFFRQADDATMVPAAGPLLYALRDLEFVLAEGAHNQFGDLPWNARLEMMMEQWILSRGEIQDFLRGRRMVPYPEGWMTSVDAMKTVQGWSGTSVIHFRNLAVCGEQLLLSIREGAWAGADATAASAWAVVFRDQIEEYIHAYRAVTGIDLAVDPTDPRFLAERDTPPSVHLRKRLAQEIRR